MQQPLSEMFWRFALAAGVGLLVGLQRESVAAPLAGLRTFALATLAGLVSGWLGPVVTAGVFLGFTGLVVAGYLATAAKHDDHGLTTEVTLLLMFVVGAYLAHGSTTIGGALGASTAVLLHFKDELHGFARKFTATELKAMMEFALISLVVLPALPDQAYGPFSVLNPRHVWLMVVLIVAINLAGYLAFKFLDPGRNIILAGLLGGAVSSTATTAAYSRAARPLDRPGVPAMIILLASATVFVRLGAEIGLAAPALVGEALPRLAVPMAILAGGAFWMWRNRAEYHAVMAGPANPAEMRLAVAFAAVYSLVLVAAAAGRAWLGETGLFAVAVVSGLTDVDAITLSTAQLYNTGRLDPAVAWRVVLTAALSNLAFKLGIAAVVGGPRLFRSLASAFVLAGIAVVVLLFL